MSLNIFSENKSKLLALHEKTQKDLDKDVIILKDWIKQEPHLPETLLKDENFLEISLIRNKYSIQKTKRKIENYCTMKLRYGYLLDNVGTIKPREESSFLFYIEKLNGDFRRIMISKVFDEGNYDIARDFGMILTQRELTTRSDYNDGEIIIADYTECSTHFITKLRVNVFVDGFTFALKGHSARIREIHVVNKWANAIISFAKRLIPEKVVNRINVHSHATIDTLKDFIPKCNLPRDYGGEMKSFNEMKSDWERIFKENRDLLETGLKTMSRNELRIEPASEELQGTFKRLTVD